jgi:hypothetical protein
LKPGEEDRDAAEEGRESGGVRKKSNEFRGGKGWKKNEN